MSGHAGLDRILQMQPEAQPLVNSGPAQAAAPANAIQQNGTPVAGTPEVFEPLTLPDLSVYGQPANDSVTLTTDTPPSADDRLVPNWSRRYLPSSLFPERNGLPAVGEWWLSLEAVFADFDDSSALVGDSRAPQVFSERYGSASIAAIDGAVVGTDEIDPSIVGEVRKRDTVRGTRLRLGYRLPTNGGFEFTSLWMGESERYFQRGLGGFDAGANPDTVRVTAALPLFDGASGYAVPFDQHFRFALDTDVNTWGIHYAPQGRWFGGVLVQPTFGVTSIDFDEGFSFSGASAGLDYTHNTDGSVDPDSLDPPVAVLPPFQAVLRNTTDTWMFGPMVGFNYSTSGKLVRVSGTTRLGIMMANSEQVLAGQGFDNPLSAGFDQTRTFRDSRKRTYGTGAIEQSINLDLNVLRLVPPLDRIDADHTLLLRFGWSITAVHEVPRASDNIVWQGFPRSPELTNETSSWAMHTWSIGAVWQY